MCGGDILEEEAERVAFEFVVNSVHSNQTPRVSDSPQHRNKRSSETRESRAVCRTWRNFYSRSPSTEISRQQGSRCRDGGNQTIASSSACQW